MGIAALFGHFGSLRPQHRSHPTRHGIQQTTTPPCQPTGLRDASKQPQQSAAPSSRRSRTQKSAVVLSRISLPPSGLTVADRIGLLWPLRSRSRSRSPSSRRQFAGRRHGTPPLNVQRLDPQPSRHWLLPCQLSGVGRGGCPSDRAVFVDRAASVWPRRKPSPARARIVGQRHPTARPMTRLDAFMGGQRRRRAAGRAVACRFSRGPAGA